LHINNPSGLHAPFEALHLGQG